MPNPLSSTMAAELKAGDNLTSVLANADDLARALSADARATAHGAASSSRIASTLQAQLTTMKNWFKTPRTAGAAAADTAQTAAIVAAKEGDNVATAAVVNAEKAQVKTLTDAGQTVETATVNTMKSKYNINSSTILGVSLTAYAIYSMAAAGDTDGATIDINKITILTQNEVQIDYTYPGALPPGRLTSAAFCIRVNDALDLSGCTQGCTIPALPSGLKVKRILSDTSLVLATPASMTSAGGVSFPASSTNTPSGTSSGPAGSPVNVVPTGTAYWGRAIVHSSVSNQFVGSLGDTLSTFITSSGLLLGQALGAVGEGLSQGIEAAAPGIGAAAGAAAGALGGAAGAAAGALGGAAGAAAGALGGAAGAAANALGLGSPAGPLKGKGFCGLPIISSICEMGSGLRNILMIVCGIIFLLLILGLVMKFSGK